MVKSFPTFEAAALEVAELRSKGYRAWVQDEYSSAFWGPAAIGGVRVISSEGPVDGNADPLARSRWVEMIFAILRSLVLILTGVAVAFVVLVLGSLALADPVTVGVLVLTILVHAVLFLAIAATIGMTSHHFLRTSLLRTQHSRSGFDQLLVYLVLLLIFATLISCSY